MGITRTVTTQVYCDVCGKWVIGWESEETGVSREWAKYHARCKGCTAGQKVICKECRIKQRIKKCSLQKKWGAAGMDGGACLGFSHDGDDEPIERCKRCIAYTSFDWDEEKGKMKKAYRNGSFVMNQSTFDTGIDGMEDKNGQPIGRTNYGVNGEETYRFMGKNVETVEDDVLPSWDDANEGDVIAVFMNFSDYVINTNMEMQVVKWTDHDNNKIKNKGYTA